MIYDAPPSGGALRQGEIVGSVWEHAPRVATDTMDVLFRSYEHPLLVVLTADCDLERDFNSQYSAPALEPTVAGSAFEPRPFYALLADLFEEANIRNNFSGSQLWKRASQNQDERYHHLSASQLAGGDPLPDLYIDFKRIFALPTVAIYQGLDDGSIRRVAVVPHTFVHDLMHRCYAFLGRVGVPEPNQLDGDHVTD